MHPTFDLTGVQTHDLQIMDSIFHVSEMPVFTESSGISLFIYLSFKEIYCHLILEVRGEYA